MNELFKWLLNLNAVVMPMRYLWVFLAFILLSKQVDKFQSDYHFIKNKVTGMIVGGWCLAFTAFACILGMVPKLDMSANPGTWWFQLALNILTPVIFLALGLILPAIARHDKKKLA